jgi:hypothetical protein
MTRGGWGRTVPASLPPLPIAAAITALVVANAWFTAWTIAELVQYPDPVDWRVLTTAAGRVSSGMDPYAFAFGDGSFRWSPVIAWLFVPLGVIGPLGWRLLHAAALILLLPNRRLALIAAVSWPFWFDVAAGNITTFVFVAGMLALRGNRAGELATLALAMLAPRPLVLPLAAWLIWRRPHLRAPAAALLVAHALLLLPVGWAGQWAERLFSVLPQQLGIAFDVGPARLIGPWWVPIGLALAVVLVVRNRVGWACLAAAPYWLPYYLFMPLLELERPSPRASDPYVRPLLVPGRTD